MIVLLFYFQDTTKPPHELNGVVYVTTRKTWYIITSHDNGLSNPQIEFLVNYIDPKSLVCIEMNKIFFSSSQKQIYSQVQN